MCIFLNKFKRVIILLHVIAAHLAPFSDRKDPIGCLNLNINKPSTCLTDTCKKQADFMLDRMNFSADPCDDFYLFACGKLLNRTEKKIPPIFSVVGFQAQNNVAKILKLPVTQTDSELLKLMKTAKQECIKGGKRIHDFRVILREFGNVPMFFSGWTEDSFSWVNFYKVARKYGYEANNMFSIFVDHKTDDNTRRIIYIDEPKVYNYPVKLFPEHLTISNINRLLGRIFISDVANAFGANVNNSYREINKIIKFAAEVNKIFQNASFENLEQSILDMENKWPTVPWLEIINILIAPVKYTNADRIIVTCPNCMDKINKLLSRSTKRVIANYVLFQFILENLYLLKHSTRRTLLNQLSKPLETICDLLTIKYFDMILDHEYIKRFYNQNFTNIARSMFDNIVKELKSTIQDTRLFNSSDQRKLATEKLEGMKAKIGVNDDRILSYENLEKYYQAVNFSNPKNYLWEIRSFLLIESYSTLNQIGRPSSYLRASLLDASNHLRQNTIYISAAILQGFLAENVPQYVNYGRMSRIIAHEVTHGFTSHGLPFDKDGGKKQWADINTTSNIKKAELCFSEQLNKYKFPGTNITVNGRKVLNEAATDNGGYYLSYRAYNNLLNPVKEMTLPGFETYSQRQMFWISHATSRCEKYDPKLDAAFLITDVHPVDHLRISVGLQNSKEFSRDFHCPKNSRMNPKKKCTFWDNYHPN